MPQCRRSRPSARTGGKALRRASRANVIPYMCSFETHLDDTCLIEIKTGSPEWRTASARAGYGPHSARPSRRAEGGGRRLTLRPREHVDANDQADSGRRCVGSVVLRPCNRRPTNDFFMPASRLAAKMSSAIFKTSGTPPKLRVRSMRCCHPRRTLPRAAQACAPTVGHIAGHGLIGTAADASATYPREALKLVLRR